jgi:parallel beta-helix repeat protein
VHERADRVSVAMRSVRRIADLGRGRLLPAGAAAAACACAVVLAPVAQADQIICGQVIRTSTTITNSLAGCAGDGLVIGASGITVDLNGNTIQGTGLGAGIQNNGHDDVTIRNGALVNFDHGVVLNPGTERNSVTGLTLAKNEWSAIELNAASGNHVAQNQLSEVGDLGVRLTNGSSDNAITGNVVGAGAGDSFVVELGSHRNWLQGNVVQTSAGQAVRVEGSANTMVLANEFAGSSDVGIAMTAAPGSVVQANRLGGGGDAGVLLSGGTASVVRFNAFGQSSDAGVVLEGMSNSLVKGNSLASSGDAAIVLRGGSSDVRVIDNTASHSSDAGIFISDGAANTVRGNILTSNAHGIELSGGQQNRVEFNAMEANLGLGMEVSQSAGNTIFGNTMDGNLQGGIWVDTEATGNVIEGNAARGNGGDGINVISAGTVVRYNLARLNQGWGIHGAAGVVDGGRNGASGNAEPAQCYFIACSDGSDWVAPVRPPEPLDPLELGLPDMSAVGPRTVKAGRALRSGRRGRRRARTAAVVVCKRRRAVRGRAARKRNRVRAVCKAEYKAKRSTRRVTGRLVRHGKPAARGARKVRGGSRGMVSLLARKRLGGGRYRLVLSYRAGRHRGTVTRRTVRLRFLGD